MSALNPLLSALVFETTPGGERVAIERSLYPSVISTSHVVTEREADRSILYKLTATIAAEVNVREGHNRWIDDSTKIARQRILAEVFGPMARHLLEAKYALSSRRNIELAIQRIDEVLWAMEGNPR